MLACQDMPVGGAEVREAMAGWEQELKAPLAARIAALEVDLVDSQKTVTYLHDGLNKLFKEAVALRNENRRLKKQIEEEPK